MPNVNEHIAPLCLAQGFRTRSLPKVNKHIATLCLAQGSLLSFFKGGDSSTIDNDEDRPLANRANKTQKKGQGAKVWDVAFYKRALSLLG